MSSTSNKVRGTFNVWSVGTSEIESSIQLIVHSDLHSSLSISPKNKMRGTIFKVIARENSDLESSIFVSGQSDLSSSLFIKPDNLMEGIGTFVALRNSDLESSLQLAIPNDLPGLLSIRPYNKMEGIAEIQQPPSVTQKLYPTKDTFVRTSYPKLNYGGNEDMFVGNTRGESYRSLLQFDTDQLPKSKYIKSAQLVLNTLGTSNHPTIQALNIRDDWTEFGTTWANQPTTDNELFRFSGGSKIGELRVDIKSLVTNWYAGQENKGLLLKAIDETLNASVSYSTKENQIKPYIEVVYYDTDMYNFGRGTLKSNIYVWPTGSKDLNSSLDVNARIVESNLNASIEVHDPKQIEGSIIITKENLPSSILVNRYGTSYLSGKLYVGIHETWDHDAAIHVRANGIKDFKGSILPRFQDQSDFSASVDVHHKVDISSNLSVRQSKWDTLSSCIDVHKVSDLQSSVVVHKFSVLEGSLTVRDYQEINLNGKITVHHTDDLTSSITVRQYTNLNGNVKVRVSDSNTLFSSIDVHEINELPSSINVYQNSSLGGELYVKYATDNNLNTSLDVTVYSEIEASLFVLSEYLKSRVMVVRKDESDLTSYIHVRVEKDDSLDSTITISLNKNSTLFSSLIVERNNDINIPGKITIRANDESNLTSSIDVYQKSELPSTISVLVSAWKDLHSSVDVHHMVDLTSSLMVHEVSDLPSSLFAIHDGENDFLGNLLPRIPMASDLETTLRIGGGSYPYVFIM